MDLKGKIAVITAGVSSNSTAIANLFKKEGAVVIITDVNETVLKEKALKLDVTALPTNLNSKENIQQFIRKVIHQFGCIDIFIFNTGTSKFGNPFLPDAGYGSSWQSNILTQMYTAKYLLPYMIKKGNGYLVHLVPMEGLFAEFHSPLYSTIEHAALFFAKRLSSIYKNANIKVSALCLGALMNLPTRDNLCTDRKLTLEEKQAYHIVEGIHREQFLIPSYEKICDLYQTYPNYKETRMVA